MTAEHNAWSNKRQRKCQICNLDHLTGLHGYILKKKDTTSSNDPEQKQDKKYGGDNVKSNFAEMDLKSASASITSNAINMYVVPIKMSYAGIKQQHLSSHKWC